jgi:hypothetical protein
MLVWYGDSFGNSLGLTSSFLSPLLDVENCSSEWLTELSKIHTLYTLFYIPYLVLVNGFSLLFNGQFVYIVKLVTQIKILLKLELSTLTFKKIV